MPIFVGTAADNDLPTVEQFSLFDGIDVTLVGGAGNDTLRSLAGQDLVFGEGGDDSLNGNQGNDTVFGGIGNDTVRGGKDADILYGNEGLDSLLGDLGDDLVYGNAGQDTLRGGDGLDTLRGGKDADYLFGEVGDDFLFGDLGADTLEGGFGNDEFAIGRRDDISPSTTTGGFGAIDADVIQDFTVGQDKIRLLGGLAFGDADLEIRPGVAAEGLSANDTVIFDGTRNQYLAIVKNVTATELDNAANFISDAASNDPGAGLVGAELVVAQQAGALGQVTLAGATDFAITGIQDDSGADRSGSVTIDSSGNLVLTAAGQAALASVTSLDVTIKATNGTTDPESTVRIYSKIDDAINDTAIGDAIDSSGDMTGQNTIRVLQGSYYEDLGISKEVKLIGPNQSVLGSGARSAEAKIEGAITFGADGDNVVFDGFQFGDGGTASATSIDVTNADTLTITNSNFNTTGDATDNQIIFGGGVSDLKVTRNQIRDLTGTPTAQEGIKLMDVTNAELLSNRLEGLTESAIDLDGASSAKIAGNTVIVPTTKTGLKLDPTDFTDVDVLNNEINAIETDAFGIVVGAAVTGNELVINQNNLTDDGAGGGFAIDYNFATGALNAKSNAWIPSGVNPTNNNDFRVMAGGTVDVTGATPVRFDVPLF